MPRPKGSKNKPKIVSAPANLDEQIRAVTAEIVELTEKIKEKKAALKTLEKAKAAADKVAAKKKAEEDKKTILEAVEASGKSVEEILNLLK